MADRSNIYAISIVTVVAVVGLVTMFLQGGGDGGTSLSLGDGGALVGQAYSKYESEEYEGSKEYTYEEESKEGADGYGGGGEPEPVPVLTSCRPDTNGVQLTYSDGSTSTMSNTCSGDTLNQYVCTSWDPARGAYTNYELRSNSCGSGYICSESGRAHCELAPGVTCTDEGNDLGVRESVTLTYTSGARNIVPDACSGPGEFLVNQTVCIASSGSGFYDVFRMTQETCPSGTVCSDGACVVRAK